MKSGKMVFIVFQVEEGTLTAFGTKKDAFKYLKEEKKLHDFQFNLWAPTKTDYYAGTNLFRLITCKVR